MAANVKYIHSDLRVYSLKAYAKIGLKQEDGRGKEGFLPSAISADELMIKIGEHMTNGQMDMVLRDIYQRQPDALEFPYYTWDIGYVTELVHDIHKVLSGCDIRLGGLEVPYDAGAVLRKEPAVTGIMKREGEEIFTRLVEYYVNQDVEQAGTSALTGTAELAFRGEEGTIREDSIQPVMDMSQISFPYGDLTGYGYKIIYYESSHGCPLSCSYCLPSIDKSARFRDLGLVKRELVFSLEYKMPRVKFVDRAFNCKKSYAIAIWQCLLKHDNGVTNFHSEISADLLDERKLSLIERMRPGLIQLGIDVQTISPDTIRGIRRTMDLEKSSAVVVGINRFGNAHQHLDSIAGLPYEGYERFQQSSGDAHAMRPEQLQLSLLKVLKGSCMEEMAGAYGPTYKEKPPYGVLSVRWLNYGKILKLKTAEEVVEAYYNSGQSRMMMAMLEKEFDSPFRMYEELAGEYESLSLFDVSHSRLTRYEILFQFIEKRYYRLGQYRGSLMYSLYLRENIESRPSSVREQMMHKTVVRDSFIKEAENPHYLMGYESYDSRQVSGMTHMEAMGDGNLILFDYSNRDPLNYNAEAVKIDAM